MPPTEIYRPTFLLVFIIAFQLAYAETYTGRVVGVSDGDTITILDRSNAQHKVRLSGIDAPEKAQPFGQRSKQSLSAAVFGKQVTVDSSKRDCRSLASGIDGG